MIIHFHYSLYENSGEIRRIKNIDKDVAAALSDEIVEVVFVSPLLYPKRRRLHFTLSNSVKHKIYVPEIPYSYSTYFFKKLNSIWMSLVMFFVCIRYNPSYVIGEYNISFQSFLFGPWKNRYIMDCHGDIVDEYVYASPRPDKRVIKYFNRMERLGAKHAKYIVCQSATMKKLLLSRYAFLDANKIYVYRCSADLSRFNLNKELRSQYRKRLGITDDAYTLFVYSGGMHKWQKVDDSISIFGKYHAMHPLSGMLILTLDAKTAEEKVRNSKDVDAKSITILSVSHEEVCGYLNAADVAFLLRDNVTLNAVASPTKLAEYMACGLPVISNNVASNWLEASMFFNIDKNDVENIASFLKAHSKQQLSDYAKGEFSIEKDKLNLKRLIDNESKE